MRWFTLNTAPGTWYALNKCWHCWSSWFDTTLSPTILGILKDCRGMRPQLWFSCLIAAKACLWKTWWLNGKALESDRCVFTSYAATHPAGWRVTHTHSLWDSVFSSVKVNHNSTYFTRTKKLSQVSCRQAALLFCWGRRLVSKGILPTCPWLQKPPNPHRRSEDLVLRVTAPFLHPYFS